MDDGYTENWNKVNQKITYINDALNSCVRVEKLVVSISLPMKLKLEKEFEDNQGANKYYKSKSKQNHEQTKKNLTN